ncbi:MAG TPA: SPOR domain-containing protein [Rhodocyclaceae bacterium]|nr:SPOR domain-containing protein [Rhodocyclaceae bacterium]
MAQNEPDAAPDGQLELKKRSRRRLVGAAALALLAAIVLPMVMDHEPRPPTQDIQIRIPSQDAGIAARILPNHPTATPLPPAPPDSAAEAKPEAPAEAAPKPAEEAKPAEKPADQPVAKPAEKAAEKPVAKPAEKPAEKPAAKAEANAEQWIVQLGAYRDSANVKQLTAKLKQLGVPSQTENFDSAQGARTRVRAGPFKSREAAEQAQAKIRKIGVTGKVVQK